MAVRTEPVEARTTTLRAGLYARLSLVKAGDNETATERQTEHAEQKAAALGATVVHRWTDSGRSGWTGADREAFDAMLTAVENGELDLLVVWKFDRLTRNLKDWSRFYSAATENGVRLVSVVDGVDTATPAGRKLAHLLWMQAEGESESISERVKDQKRELLRNGRWLGGARPFGYRIVPKAERTPDGPDLVVVPEEADVVREAADRLLRGDGLLTIANDLNERGVTTSRGNKLGPQSVKRMVSARSIIAEYDVDGESVPCRWEPILDKATYRRVNSMLSDPSRRVSPRVPRKYLLIGLMRCGRCGSRMGSQPYTTRGNSVPAYACFKKRGGCGRMRVVAEPVETIATEEALRLLRSDEVRAALQAQDAGTDEHVADLYAQLEGLAQREQELAEVFAQGDLPATAYAAATRELSASRERLQNEVRNHSATTVTADLDDDALGEDFDSLPLERKRAIIATVVEAVVVNPSPSRGGRTFDPDRLSFDLRV